jgi:hypothetical protein
MKKVLSLSLAFLLAACSDATGPLTSSSPAKPGKQTQAPDPILVYSNDFSGTVGGEWSSNTVSTSPSGQRFLGEFLNQQVGLLVLLPPHSQLVVQADIYFIRSWDGTGTEYGPDTFNMGVDATTLLNTTISNVDSNQNYPNASGGSQVAAGTGALATNTLGYIYWDEQIPIDATYRFTYTLNHTAAAAFIHWQASGLQYLLDESWGIDNVRISYIP